MYIYVHYISYNTFLRVTLQSSGSQPCRWRGQIQTLLEGRTKEILTQVNWHVFIYRRLKPVTQNFRGFVERLLRAAQRVLVGRMRLSEQRSRTTAVKSYIKNNSAPDGSELMPVAFKDASSTFALHGFFTGSPPSAPSAYIPKIWLELEAMAQANAANFKKHLCIV